MHASVRMHSSGKIYLMALSLIVLASASLPLPRGSETSAPPFNDRKYSQLPVHHSRSLDAASAANHHSAKSHHATPSTGPCVHLVVTVLQGTERQTHHPHDTEVAFAIASNLRNTYINAIHAIVEHREAGAGGASCGPLKHAIGKIGARAFDHDWQDTALLRLRCTMRSSQPSYRELLNYANHLVPPSCTAVLVNADGIFDETVGRLRTLPRHAFVALSVGSVLDLTDGIAPSMGQGRHILAAAYAKAVPWGREQCASLSNSSGAIEYSSRCTAVNTWSFDGFAFRPPLPVPPPSQLPDDLFMNTMRAENRFAWSLIANGSVRSVSSSSWPLENLSKPHTNERAATCQLQTSDEAMRAFDSCIWNACRYVTVHHAHCAPKMHRGELLPLAESSLASSVVCATWDECISRARSQAQHPTKSCRSELELQQLLSVTDSVSPLFSAQRMCYFTSIAAKSHLFNLLRRSTHEHTSHSALVVGVREGDDVIDFARNMRMHVVGIDPADVTARLKTRIETGDLNALSPQVNLTIAAAGWADVEVSSIGRQVTIDRLVREWQERDPEVAREIDLLSIDIDGPEPVAVAGAAETLRKGAARMVIIEASFSREPNSFGEGHRIECTQREGRVQMLHALTKNYALLDYVPWGFPAADSEDKASWASRDLRSHTSAEFGSSRPQPVSVRCCCPHYSVGHRMQDRYSVGYCMQEGTRACMRRYR